MNAYGFIEIISLIKEYITIIFEKILDDISFEVNPKTQQIIDCQKTYKCLVLSLVNAVQTIIENIQERI